MKNHAKIFASCLLYVFLIPNLARADVLKLKDGTQLTGHIGAWSADGTQLYFDPDGEGANQEPRWISMSDIKGIRYNAASQEMIHTMTKDARNL